MPATDRPTQDIIDDDVAFDRWHETYMNQAAAQASLQGAGVAGAGMAAAPKEQVRKFGG